MKNRTLQQRREGLCAEGHQLVPKGNTGKRHCPECFRRYCRARAYGLKIYGMAIRLWENSPGKSERVILTVPEAFQYLSERREAIPSPPKGVTIAEFLKRGKRAGKQDIQTTAEERQWAKFQRFVRIAQGCWLWTGRVSKTGIPRFYWRIGNSEATQYIWHRTNGPKPSGHTLSRICRNRLCVSPHHIVCKPKATRRSKLPP